MARRVALVTWSRSGRGYRIETGIPLGGRQRYRHRIRRYRCRSLIEDRVIEAESADQFPDLRALLELVVAVAEVVAADPECRPVMG